MPRIYFNGKSYNDIAEMPAMERRAYEQLMSMFKDEDQDGIPDIFQGDVVGNLLQAATTTIIVDGKQVSGLDGMSPEVRAKFEKGMAKLQEMGIIAQAPVLPADSQAPTWEDPQIRPSRPVIQASSAIQEEGGGSRILVVVLLVLLALLACGLAAAYYLFGQGLPPTVSVIPPPI